jgi:hypothetical protein
MKLKIIIRITLVISFIFLVILWLNNQPDAGELELTLEATSPSARLPLSITIESLELYSESDGFELVGTGYPLTLNPEHGRNVQEITLSSKVYTHVRLKIATARTAGFNAENESIRLVGGELTLPASVYVDPGESSRLSISIPLSDSLHQVTGSDQLVFLPILALESRRYTGDQSAVDTRLTSRMQVGVNPRGEVIYNYRLPDGTELYLTDDDDIEGRESQTTSGASSRSDSDQQ